MRVSRAIPKNDLIPRNDTVLQLVVFATFVALVIALLIPVVLNAGENAAAQKVAKKADRHHFASFRQTAVAPAIEL